jgi:dihydrofolate reductase
MENRQGETPVRKLKIIEHISLDGVIQNSTDGDGFPFHDWTAPYRSAEGGAAMFKAQGENCDLLLGRLTYDLWAQIFPQLPGNPVADSINAATKFVVTNRPESLDWGPVESVGDDIAAGVRRIKEQDGPDLILSGSSTLTSTLLEHGLADELLLVTYPVLLGTGKRLFAEGTAAQTYEVAETTALPSGLIFTIYQVAGPLKPA